MNAKCETVNEMIDKCLPSVQLQAASNDIWKMKYQLTDKEGNEIDQTIDDTFKRVAKSLSKLEKDSDYWYEQFLWALHHGAIPAGRILSNVGAEAYKPNTSTINCTVSDTIKDSMDDILSKVHKSGLTLSAGCGIGYEYSTLRPNGAFVNGAGASTSGPLSFMDIFDKACFTISSAGGRRGAQMATFDISHPDVMDFIKAKREDGRFRQFNLSLLITADFMKQVEKDGDWQLVFPASPDEYENEATEIVYRHWPYIHKKYMTDSEGKVACKVYKTIKARNLWDMTMSSTYDFAEPGFILIDKVNEMNNNWFDEDIRATNP